MAKKKVFEVPPSPGLGITDVIDARCMTHSSVYSPQYVRFDSRIYQKTQIRTALFTMGEMARMPIINTNYKLPIGILIPWNTASFVGYIVALEFYPEDGGDPVTTVYKISSRKFMTAHYRTRNLPGSVLDMAGLQVKPLVIRRVIYQ